MNIGFAKTEIVEAVSELVKDVEMWKVRYEESNHYLDMLCNQNGIAQLQELVNHCDCEICGVE